MDVFDMLMKNTPYINSLVADNKTDYYAIGDVHGCLTELKSLVELCRLRSYQHHRNAKIILLGDLIDRGPYFVEIFDFLRANPDIDCVIGNHEYNFFLERKGVIECKSKERRKNHKVFEEQSTAVQDYIIKRISRMYNVVKIDMQDIESQYMASFLSHSPVKGVECSFHAFDAPAFCMRSDAVDFDLMDENQKFPILYVHGHQSWNFEVIEDQLDSQISYTNTFVNLDSGCVYGDGLTAFCLNDEKVIEVDSKKVYHNRH